jgi:hypothetical protein
LRVCIEACDKNGLLDRSRRRKLHNMLNTFLIDHNRPLVTISNSKSFVSNHWRTRRGLQSAILLSGVDTLYHNGDIGNKLYKMVLELLSK